MRANAPGRSSQTTVIRCVPATSSSSSIRTSSLPAAIVAIVPSSGNRRHVRAVTSPPSSTWRVRATRSSTSCSFHGPHADGPVASESASVRAWSSSSVSDHRPHRRRDGSSPGRRDHAERRRPGAAGGAPPAAPGSSRSGRRDRGAARSSGPVPSRPRCGRPGSPCRYRGTARRARAGPAGRPGRRARRRWPPPPRGAGRR